jgi:hypothetical protein
MYPMRTGEMLKLSTNTPLSTNSVVDDAATAVVEASPQTVVHHDTKLSMKRKLPSSPTNQATTSMPSSSSSSSSLSSSWLSSHQQLINAWRVTGVCACSFSLQYFFVSTINMALIFYDPI